MQEAFLAMIVAINSMPFNAMPIATPSTTTLLGVATTPTTKALLPSQPLPFPNTLQPTSLEGTTKVLDIALHRVRLKPQPYPQPKLLITSLNNS